MTISPRERNVLLAIAASLLFWTAVAAFDVRVETGNAALPGYATVLNRIDKEIGTKVVERAKKEFDQRYARELDAASGKLTALEGRVGDPATLTAEAETLATTYRKEAVKHLNASVYEAYFDQTYKNMLSEYTKYMDQYVALQSKINDVEEKLNMYKKLYNKARFMVSR